MVEIHPVGELVGYKPQFNVTRKYNGEFIDASRVHGNQIKNQKFLLERSIQLGVDNYDRIYLFGFHVRPSNDDFWKESTTFSNT